MNNTTAVNPGTLFLDDLISDVNRGGLKVPAFQRKYVWNKVNVIDLFESIYKGFPIGSLLFWSTETKLKTNNNFKIDTKNNSFRYILDGQQRLTTLYHTLSGNIGDDDIWEVYFDLEKEIFIHLEKKEKRHSALFPMSKLLNTLDFFKESKRILLESGDEKLIEKAEDLAGKIRKYKLAIINLEGGGIDDAIEIFTRLNRTGMKIEPIDLISALNYDDEKMGAFQEISKKLEDIALKYGFIDEDNDSFGDTILKTIRISLGYQIYAKDDTEKVAESVKSDKFSSISNRTSDAFEETIKYLTENLNFFSQKELPYINIFYMVFSFFFSRSKNIDLLEKTIYQGSISGLFKTSPSETDVLIKFFASDFNEEKLTKKLKSIISSPETLKYLDETKSGLFNAKSAIAKVTFNIISNHYLSNENSNRELLRYPPGIYSICFNKERLGNKSFFISPQSESESAIFDRCENNIMTFDNSIIEQRESKIHEIIYNFLKDRELI
jgi:hypothetical protein